MCAGLLSCDPFARLSPLTPLYLIENRMLTLTAIISVMTLCAVRTVHTTASNRASSNTNIIEKKQKHNEFILSHIEQRAEKKTLFVFLKSWIFERSWEWVIARTEHANRRVRNVSECSKWALMLFSDIFSNLYFVGAISHVIDLWIYTRKKYDLTIGGAMA